MKHRIARHRRALALAITCVALGVGIGAITSAGAATTTTAASSAQAGSAVVQTHHRWLRRHGGLLRRAVQGSVVVRTATGFGTASFERGTVTSISGAQLTLTEGTRKASYRSVTVTIPTDARIRDDGNRGDISSLKAGQRVLVISAPQRTIVIARTPKSR